MFTRVFFLDKSQFNTFKMVTLAQAQATNALASTSLPPGLVGVFAGATSGIGSTALLAFAKHVSRPKIYFIGRSSDAAADLIKQMKESNPDGEYIFLEKDLSLLKNVDEVCKEILFKEKAINLLVMSQGGLIMGGTYSWYHSTFYGRYNR